jgi:hypothetical protein
MLGVIGAFPAEQYSALRPRSLFCRGLIILILLSIVILGLWPIKIMMTSKIKSFSAISPRPSPRK